ncbi:uncharacterized protein [Salvelinus sp. IW2-2015]|uniref:uncharacterized protein n=1 Tax=Salvelinus sp. IW2-2015 TaxID=2691554 RepID=UPI0038D3B090
MCAEGLWFEPSTGEEQHKGTSRGSRIHSHPGIGVCFLSGISRWPSDGDGLSVLPAERHQEELQTGDPSFGEIHTKTGVPNQQGGGAVRDLLHPVASVSGGGEHEEGLLSFALLTGFQGEPAGTQPEPSPRSHAVERNFMSSLTLYTQTPWSIVTFGFHVYNIRDMCVVEGELEILLGELHIKIQGLIGFAQLCPGDQYEVVIRLGRPRRNIRSKIKTDDRQS